MNSFITWLSIMLLVLLTIWLFTLESRIAALENRTNLKLEHLTSSGSDNQINSEALMNLASMYNSGTLTLTNLNVTGTITSSNITNSGDITSSGTMTAQNITDKSGSVVKNGDIIKMKNNYADYGRYMNTCGGATCNGGVAVTYGGPNDTNYNLWKIEK